MLKTRMEVLEKDNEALKQSEQEALEIIAELKEENARLNQQVKDLKDFAEKLSEEHASEWEQQQNIITKMRCCENCEDYLKQYETTGCPDCTDLSQWRLNHEEN